MHHLSTVGLHFSFKRSMIGAHLIILKSSRICYRKCCKAKQPQLRATTMEGNMYRNVQLALIWNVPEIDSGQLVNNSQPPSLFRNQMNVSTIEPAPNPKPEPEEKDMLEWVLKEHMFGSYLDVIDVYIKYKKQRLGHHTKGVSRSPSGFPGWISGPRAFRGSLFSKARSPRCHSEGLSSEEVDIWAHSVK